MLSKGLSGGLSDGTTGLTAYVLITLLTTIKSTNIQIKYDKSKILKGLLYLKSAIYEIEDVNTYTLSLCLYTFKLSNEFMDRAVIKEIEYELEKRAVIDGIWMFKLKKNFLINNSKFKAI